MSEHDTIVIRRPQSCAIGPATTLQVIQTQDGIPADRLEASGPNANAPGNSAHGQRLLHMGDEERSPSGGGALKILRPIRHQIFQELLNGPWGTE